MTPSLVRMVVTAQTDSETTPAPVVRLSSISPGSERFKQSYFYQHLLTLQFDLA